MGSPSKLTVPEGQHTGKMLICDLHFIGAVYAWRVSPDPTDDEGAVTDAECEVMIPSADPPSASDSSSSTDYDVLGFDANVDVDVEFNDDEWCVVKNNIQIQEDRGR